MSGGGRMGGLVVRDAYETYCRECGAPVSAPVEAASKATAVGKLDDLIKRLQSAPDALHEGEIDEREVSYLLREAAAALARVQGGEP